MALCSGCYFGPIEVIPSNLEPVLIDANHPPGETITMSRDQAVYIVVEDEEPTKLQFVWTLSDDGFIGDAETMPAGETYGGSQVKLEVDHPLLDGQILGCVVSDREYELRLSWPLEVVQ
ncbi:hypothetical protein L6R49_31065 [Myxococcota bacterium]|nr:hypothetical protein [Myxococcota bacterium]